MGTKQLLHPKITGLKNNYNYSYFNHPLNNNRLSAPNLTSIALSQA